MRAWPAGLCVVMLHVACVRKASVADHDLPTQPCTVEAGCVEGEAQGGDLEGAAFGVAALVSFTVLLRWWIDRD